MILLRLGVRPDGTSIHVDDAHRVRNDVEDRFELRDASRQAFTELLSLGDVVAREDDAARADRAWLRERSERGLDDTRTAAVLERHRVGNYGAPLERCINLLGEIRECVRECIVDRPAQRLPVIHARELTKTRVGADEPLVLIEDRDRKRNRLEEGVQTCDLRALAASDVAVCVRQARVGHRGQCGVREGPVSMS